MPGPIFDFALARELRSSMSGDAFELRAAFAFSVTQSRAAITGSRRLLARPEPNRPPALPHSNSRYRRAALAEAEEYGRRAAQADDAETRTVLLEMRQLWIEIACAPRQPQSAASSL
jgi:hypothetical protein